MKKIIAIGNALVDVLVRMEDEQLLSKFNIAKGSMQLVDKEKSKEVETALYEYKKHMASGGSAANAIRGMAMLGIDVGFIGKVGDDTLGSFFYEDMEKIGVKTILLQSATETGRAIAMVSPDSERTFATYLGAAIELTSNDITSDVFKGYDVYHVEGYLVYNHELIRSTVEMASKAGLKISLDLASYNVVGDNREFLTELVKNYVDIVFANEEEAKAFCGCDPYEAVDMLGKMCEVAVVKIGKEGSLIRKGNEFARVQSIHANAIDTTGAGDLFASGFLYGYANGFDIEKSAKIGAIVAGNVVEVMGATMDELRWNNIKNLIKVL